jgi:hypothetical protein
MTLRLVTKSSWVAVWCILGLLLPGSRDRHCPRALAAVRPPARVLFRHREQQAATRSFAPSAGSTRTLTRMMPRVAWPSPPLATINPAEPPSAADSECDERRSASVTVVVMVLHCDHRSAIGREGGGVLQDGFVPPLGASRLRAENSCCRGLLS